MIYIYTYIDRIIITKNAVTYHTEVHPTFHSRMHTKQQQRFLLLHTQLSTYIDCLWPL